MEQQQLAETSPFATPKASLEQQQQLEYDTSNPLSPKGRFGRIDYIAYVTAMWLAMSLLGGIISAVFGATFAPNMASGVPAMFFILYAIIYIPMMVIGFLFMIRRLHDLNWSGWLSLTSLIPLVNLVTALILIFMRGTDGANKYGPPRKPPTKSRIVVALILPLIFILGILAAIAIPAYQQYVLRTQGM